MDQAAEDGVGIGEVSATRLHGHAPPQNCLQTPTLSDYSVSFLDSALLLTKSTSEAGAHCADVHDVSTASTRTGA